MGHGMRQRPLGKSTAVTTGRNAEYPTLRDAGYARCKQCGFICHADRDDSMPNGSKAGEGNAQPNTLLNGSVAAGATTINVDSTSGFPSSGSIYVYDAGSYATEGDVSSTYTDASGAPMCDRIDYTGITATSFTGCTGARAHDDNMVVRGERTADSGCPFCGALMWR